MKILGIDVGGSGIKAAIVHTKKGELLSERLRIPTPKPAQPDDVAKVIKKIVKHFKWKDSVGCSFPTVVKDGVCLTYGNLSPEWKGVNVENLFSKKCKGQPFYVANDADLAGLAEMRLGDGRNLTKKVVMLTIGTGIGSGVFINGELVPNIELGRIYHTDGKFVESFAADSARKRDGLTLKQWAKRFNVFLQHIELVVSPDHLIIGGGISKKFDDFREFLTVGTPMSKAQFGNNAGIIGAAMYARDCIKR